MRIVGGEWRGLTLASVGRGDAAARLRPTADRVRESLFSILDSAGAPLAGARVLDLFAGTGALGLEALSRGAAHATFVDEGRAAQALIRQNIARARCADRADLLARSALRIGPCREGPCALVFLDPPYGRDLGARALAAARASGWIAPGARVVWEESAAQPAPEGFRADETRRYGDTVLTFLEAV